MNDFPSSDMGDGVLHGFSIENLMRCPLCGAINALQNEECFVCGWAGQFDFDPESIEQGLEELMDHCPDLAEMLEPPRTRRQTWKRAIRRIWRMLTHHPLDIRA